MAQRQFRDGDEAELVTLWNRVHDGLGGSVVRSVAHWRWNVLARPGVTAEDIPIVEWRGRIGAYAVLDSRGAVLEFAVDNELHRWRRRRLFAVLLTAIEQRSRQRGDDLLSFVAPASDRQIGKLLRNAGYIAYPGSCMSLGILNAAELIRQLLTHHAERAPQGWRQSFFLLLTPGGYRSVLQPQLRIVIDRRSCSVDDSIKQPPPGDCVIATDLQTLTALVFGMLEFETALTSGQISLRDHSVTEDARRLFGLLALSTPWYTSVSDAF